MADSRPILVLAYSGGLDTSYCARKLSRDMDVELHTVIVNTGGFSSDELAEIERRARMLGSDHHVAIDAEQEFYDRCIRYLVYGNVLRNHTYPLSVSAERLFQGMRIAGYARSVGAAYIAHGSTGAGNDQVRFDLAFSTLAPEATILTPIRDNRLSREETTTYLADEGIDVEWKKTKYSINRGLWGTSIGGVETLTSDRSLPEEAWPTQITEEGTRDLRIGFEAGEIRSVDGVELDPVEAIRRLQEIAGPYGIGRDVHVGDTIIGIKGRVGFEAAAPMLIIRAHQLLEKHTLTKWQLYWKDQLANWYGMFTHEALFQEPVMRDIEAFLESTQERVRGEVGVRLYPRHFDLLGITSPFDLLGGDAGAYGEMNNAWSGDDVRGFTRILANSIRNVRMGEMQGEEPEGRGSA